MTDEKLPRRVFELETLTAVIAATSKTLDLDSILKEAARLTASLLGVERVSIMLLDEDGKTLRLVHVYTASKDFPVPPGTVRDITPDHVYASALATLQPVVVEDLFNQQRWPQYQEARRLGLKSSLSVPLAILGKAIGVINFTTETRQKKFSSEEVGLAEAIAGHLAVIIENARLHKSIAEEQATLEAIIQSMGEGLVLFDGEQTMVYSNRAAGELLGLPPDWHRGKKLPAYVRGFIPRTQDVARVVEAWERAMAHPEDRPSFPLSIVTGGQRRELLVTLFPVAVSPQNASIGTGALMRDVTREKEADRIKTDFISLVSHELRTPLTAIMGFSELLLKRPMEPREQARSLEYILKESQYLASLLDDILNISNIEAGRLSLRLEPLYLRPLIEQVAGKFTSVSTSNPFQIAVPDNLPPVLADKDKLIEALRHLLDNAVKYSSKESLIMVSSDLRQPVKEGERAAVIIAVTDKGPGIPEAEIPQLFTRFHRVKGLETQRVRGTGLGLYIARALVELMGGRIWAESKLGEGSTFYISLPTKTGGPEFRSQ